MSVSNSTVVVDGVPIPNPFTPLALLPPDLAFQVQFGIYVIVGSLGGFVWDLFVNIGNDYTLLFKRTVGLPTVVYFLSRISTLLYILLSAIFETAAIGQGKCGRLQVAPPTFFGIGLLSTSLLFYFRIRAIYAGNRLVIAFFTLLWLSVAATGLTIPWAIKGGNIGPTAYCINLSLAPYASGSIITSLIHDSLVFVAISYRLAANSYFEGDFQTRVKGFVFGTSLPRFSRAILQDGQLYYLIAVSMNLLSLIMLYVPNLPTTYRTMFTETNLAITNSIACYVFRKTKFGYIKDSRLATTTRGDSTMPLSFLRKYNRGARDEVPSTTQVEGSTTMEMDDFTRDIPSRSSASLATKGDGSGTYNSQKPIHSTTHEYEVQLPQVEPRDLESAEK